jgi:hypothetical protein
MENPAEAWDRALESQLQQTVSQQPRPRLFTQQKLARAAGESRKIKPEIFRTIAGIDQDIRDKMRGLIAGELPWPLFMTGPAGTGKTCAALCLLDFAGGIYRTVPGLCSELIQSQQGRLDYWEEQYLPNGGKIWPEEFWRRISRVPLVVLDEIGTRKIVSDAHYEAVKEGIDRRQGRPFVAISNMTKIALTETYDDRIFSRLNCGTVIDFSGMADRRLA